MNKAGCREKLSVSGFSSFLILTQRKRNPGRDSARSLRSLNVGFYLRVAELPLQSTGVQKGPERRHVVPFEMITLSSVFVASTWGRQITQHLQGLRSPERDDAGQRDLSPHLKWPQSRQLTWTWQHCHSGSSEHLGHTETPTQKRRNVGVLICTANPTPRSPARKLTDRLAVIDNDIYKGPGDTGCSDVGCDVTDHQVLIETSVK